MVTFTYIHWAECGRALYVGRTSNPENRIRTHRSSHSTGTGRSRWWPVVARIEWFRHACDWDARQHETALIEQLSPTFNRALLPLDVQRARQATRDAHARRFDRLEDRDVFLLARLRPRSPQFFDDLMSAIGQVA